MKTLHLSVSLSRAAGGIFEIQLAVTRELKALGVEVETYGLVDPHWSLDAPRWAEIETKVFPTLGLTAFGYAPGMLRAMIASQSDLVHLHYMWMYPSVATYLWHRLVKRPYMVTPNGMLEPWALRNSAWKKKLAGMVYENRVLHGAACIQANTLKELQDVRAYGLKNPVCVIPNGVVLPEADMERLTAERGRSGPRVLLFLGRLHPKKGLLNALRAWSAFVREQKRKGKEVDWVFVIAGWDQGGHEGELRRVVEEEKVEREEVSGQQSAGSLNEEESFGGRRPEFRKETKGKVIDGGSGRRDEGGGSGRRDEGGGSGRRDEGGDLKPEERGGREFRRPEAGVSERDEEGAIDGGSGALSNLDSSAEIQRFSVSASQHLQGLPPHDGEESEDFGKRLAIGGEGPRVVFFGPAFGAEKDALLRRASAFILPSFSEGLPVAVLEAWSYGLPVLMTDHCNLPEGFAAGAAQRIGTGVEEIAAGLDALASMSPSDLATMGAKGRELVERQFTWPEVARQMKAVYEWMLGGGERPETVEGRKKG